VEKQVASFAQAFRNMFVVLGNLRFMAFLLIFSGFWVMFWQEFIALPLFIRGYVNANADVDLLTTVDPLAVILFQILISYLTRKAKPFPAMTAGILITSLSWLILAICDLRWQIQTTLHVGSWTMPIQGLPVYATIALVVLAIGEMVQSPRYYEYVSRLAPPGQQGTFMGFSFLPIAIGFVVAGQIGGRLVNYYGEVLHRPNQLWFVIAGVGVLTTVLMWIYDKVIKPTEPVKQ
jgi:dipeptide/tripeptide permease